MTTKALYWIALGVFVLGINSEYHSGRLPILHAAADRAGDVLCRVASRAEQRLAMAGLLAGRTQDQLQEQLKVTEALSAEQQARIDRVLAEHQAGLDRVMALRQAELDRALAQVDRAHAVMDRVQAQRVRFVTQSRSRWSDAANRHIVLVCPKTGSKIVVDAGPDMANVDIDSDTQ